MTSSNATQTVFHVTVLSNLPCAYDKYSGHYDKALIAESTYPGEFYVLELDQLAQGIRKAGRLLEKLALPGNCLIVLQAQVASASLHPNLRTGIGRFLASSSLPVERIHYLDHNGGLLPTSIEEAMAAALALELPRMLPYAQLQPRTLSVLPVALACQAACRFCFSRTSVSSDTPAHRPALTAIRYWANRAHQAGARRFVITGGGEPGLLGHADLLELIRLGSANFPKTVLITNGVHIARKDDDQRQQMLLDYAGAGLTVLSVSRHHHDDACNAAIMGIDTRTTRLLQSHASLQQADAAQRPPRLRLICVLQRGGIDSPLALQAYVAWALAQGVNELCFKELYVSTTLESAYHANPQNVWSRENQISLAMVTDFFTQAGFTIMARLPWGAPLFHGQWKGSALTVAAYTEPSLYWERSNGMARSWNVMADGRCLVSLEDLHSDLPQMADAIAASHTGTVIPLQIAPVS